MFASQLDWMSISTRVKHYKFIPNHQINSISYLHSFVIILVLDILLANMSRNISIHYLDLSQRIKAENEGKKVNKLSTFHNTRQIWIQFIMNNTSTRKQILSHDSIDLTRQSWALTLHTPKILFNLSCLSPFQTESGINLNIHPNPQV